MTVAKATVVKDNQKYDWFMTRVAEDEKFEWFMLCQSRGSREITEITEVVGIPPVMIHAGTPREWFEFSQLQ